jgi:hypothetical protein
MKTLTNLSGVLTESNFVEPPVYHHNCGETHEVNVRSNSDPSTPDPLPLGKKGVYHRFFRTGPAGVILSNGKASVVIPREELWKLAEKYEPLLAVPERVEVPDTVK